MLFNRKYDIYKKIEIVHKSIDTIGHAYEDIYLFLDKILDLLKSLYNTTKSFIILTELTENSITYGESPSWFITPYQKIFKTKTKESEREIEILKEITLEYNQISKNIFPSYKTEVYSKMIKVLQKLKKDYNIFYPIVFQCEIYGFYFGKSNLYLQEEDIFLLDILSVCFALAIRNSVIRNENKRLRSRMLYEESETEFQKVYHRNFTVQVIHLNKDEFRVASPQMKSILENLHKLKNIQFPMLITGETGTGKEFIAKYYHFISKPQEPFIAINCSAIPESLWESELFGYKKGSFTDAKSDKMGLLEEAKKGILFFDEIAETSLEVQSKLLRLIQEKKFRPIGSTKEVEVQCNFIFATNQNLIEKIQKKQFCEDLYFRISTIHIHLPPLRERLEDIIVLLDYFVNKYNKIFNRNLSLDQKVYNFVLDLEHNFWRGNVRELENFVIQLFVNTKNDKLVFDDIQKHPSFQFNDIIKNIEQTTEEFLGLASGMQIQFEAMIKNVSKKIILEALSKCNYNKTRTARLLGISRGKLNYQMRELKIKV